MKTILFYIFFISTLWAQDIVKEISQEPLVPETAPELHTEKIESISPSKKIFIITNKNQSFNKGDFITLLLEDKLVARALAAKDQNEVSGIKILKIYSLELWKKLHPNKEVQILRGDDSYFLNLKKKNETATAPEGVINNEEDLYNDTLLQEDISLEENKNRHIKTDNVAGLSAGRISGVDLNGASAGYLAISAHWMYQVADNFWGEISYAQSNISGFPAEDLSTRLSAVTLRVKYTFKAPLYSYLQPYIGFQIRSASSPVAGKNPKGQTLTDAQKQRELSLVAEMEQNTIVFGVSVLKRLVPGWFAKADLGSDFLSLGLSVEF